MTNKKIKSRFKWHQTFILRDGWINKALTAIVNGNKRIFIDKKEAADILGVGTNMAASIRNWLKVFNLIEENPKSGASITWLGKIIYQNDKYLENQFTLWLLQYNIATNKELATTWNIVFNKIEIDEYTKEDIYKVVQKEVANYLGSDDFSEKSVNADIDLLINMYAKEKSENYDPEDNIISVFSKLQIIKNSNGLYTKNIPNKNTLDEHIVLYGILKQMKDDTTISIESLLDDENSVGKIFNLNRILLLEYLNILENKEYLKVTRTAGLDSVKRETQKNSNEIIENYYKEKQR